MIVYCSICNLHLINDLLCLIRYVSVVVSLATGLEIVPSIQHQLVSASSVALQSTLVSSAV